MKYQPPFEYGSTPATPGIHSSNADAAYVNGDPLTGEEGSIPPAEAFEHPMREILAVIEDADIEPDHEDLTQLLQALKKLARAEVKLKTEGGGVAVYHGRDDTDFAHRIRSLRPGTNVSITVDTDGALLISATGGGGGGGADTTSGLGVQINVDTTADLAFQRIPAGPGTLADADRFAYRLNADGVHKTITWAQMKALLDDLVDVYVTENPVAAEPNISAAFVVPFTTGGLDLGVDINVGSLRLTAQTSASVAFEISRDAGATWVAIGSSVGEVGGPAYDAYDVYFRSGSVVVSRLGSPGSGFLQTFTAANGAGNTKIRAVGMGSAMGIRTS